jgi:hypothetical protein
MSSMQWINERWTSNEETLQRTWLEYKEGSYLEEASGSDLI